MIKRATTKEKTVLKEFSQLKQKERIEIVALKIFGIVHKGEKDYDFEPRRGTEMHRAWNAGQFNKRQQIGWWLFRKDCDDACGKSGGVTSGYGEFTDGGSNPEKMPTAYSNAAYDRVEHILYQYLDRHERALLADLVQHDMKLNSKLTLEFIGLAKSGFKGKRDAYVSGVTNIQALLSRLSTYYGY